MNTNTTAKWMLATLAALMCVISLKAQTQTVVNVKEKNATVTQQTTLYVGEVILDGQQSFCYLYSTDMCNSEYVFAAARSCLSDFKEGMFSALVPNMVGESDAKGIAVCSNSDYTPKMNSDWTSAVNAGQACFPNAAVGSSSSNDLYEMDADFAAKCRESFDEEGVLLYDHAGKTLTISGILGKLSATYTDGVTYTVIDGKLVKHIDRIIDYTCEMITVVYTKVELNSLSGIQTTQAKADHGDATLYDLMGRRAASQSHPGIYVKNGRKVLVGIKR